jgi:hypothetical protein
VKQKISSGAVGYIVGYVASTSQKRQAGVSDANWANNIHGAAFGIIV